MQKTVTTIFMVPTLGVEREVLYQNGFINGYSYDKLRDVQYDDTIYLLFKPENLFQFKMFLDDQTARRDDIIDDYDYTDGYVVIVYKLPAKFKKDFELVRKGQYSKTSKPFQESFKKVVKIVKNGLRQDEISLQYRIFNKTADLLKYWEDKLGVVFEKNYELWNGFHIENETLDIEKIRKNVQSAVT